MSRLVAGAPPADLLGAPAGALSRNVGWGLFGSFAYAGCQWAMLIVLAKIGSLEMAGQFALGLAIGAPVFLLSNLSLRSLLATDVASTSPFGDYLALRLATVGLGLAAIGALVGLAGFRSETSLVCLLVGAAKAIEAVGDVLHGLMQRHERMDVLAGSIVLRGLGSLGALAVGLGLTGSLAWALALVAGVWALVLVGYDVPQARRLGGEAVRPRWYARDLARLARLALPLGVTAMLISLSVTIPRYFVERYRGEVELGAFVAMTSLVIIGGTAVNAVGQSVSPRLAALYAAGDRERVRRLLTGLVGLGLCLGGAGLVIAWGCGREILALLYRAEFARYADALGWIMAAAAASYAAAFLGHAMTAARLLRVQLPLFAAVGALAFVTSALFIPRWGLLGAGQATLVTGVGQLLVSGLVLRYAGGRVRESR